MSFPTGRSAYKPGMARLSDHTPQTHPDEFSVEDIRAEIRYLERLDKRYGFNIIRAARRMDLRAVIVKRG